jgi:histidyl-tRNA synthetase
MATSLPKGTRDIYGLEVLQWKMLEETINSICNDFGFSEIRTPIFEYTELFIKTTGETSDIVLKEMYTFNDRGGKSLTLKPEATPPVVRAFINNNMTEILNPTKLYYITPLFRCERPQAGRMRQFNQFGIEAFGSYLPNADVEVISIAYELFNRLGLENIELRINTLGCKHCRTEYDKKLKSFLKQNISKLCPLCVERYDKKPLRILDCKNEKCQEVLIDVPLTIDSLGEECNEHFTNVQAMLKNIDIPFVIDPKIVRGLDYYSRTVFEFISSDLGAQSTVCGGGRYDDLVQNSGGNQTGGVGFGLGLERLIMIMEKQDKMLKAKNCVDVFVGHIGEKGLLRSQSLVFKLRQNSISAESDLLNRTVKGQLKYSNKIGSKYTIIIGENEIETDIVTIKNMNNGEQKQLPLNDVLEFFKDEKS